MSDEKKPMVLSYCATFLKPEMLHIYRQITGLHRYNTIILTQSRENCRIFPFTPVVEIPPSKIDPISRLYRKYVRRLEPLIYRGEFDQLLKIVNAQQADLMHVYFGHIGVHLLPFLRHWKKPTVVSFHGMDTMTRDARHERGLRELFETACLILVRSESLKHKLISRGCREEKIRLNRTGIPMESFPKAQRTFPGDGAWKLIQVCRFIEKKGIEDSLQAFAKFQHQFPKAQFHIVGDGPLRDSLKQIAKQLKVGTTVQFHDFCSQQELDTLLAQSHIFLHPSRRTSAQDEEGIPNAILEAMATGLPVVATTHGGIPEAVTDGEEGLLVEEGDWNALAECLSHIALAPDRWAALGTAAAARVRKKFERSVQIENLERVYDEARGYRL